MPQGQQRSWSDADPLSATTSALKRRFDVFRRHNRSRARIPDGLRASVLAAVAGGISVEEVCRSCAISSSQIERWRECQGEGRTNGGGSAVAEPKVLSVVDGSAADSGGEAAEISVTVGKWHMTVRVEAAGECEF